MSPPAAGRIVHSEAVMGTVVTFDLRGPHAHTAGARRALRRGCLSLQRADAVFSIWKPESPVSRLRRGDIGLDEAPPEVAEVLDLCRRLRHHSGGWFDPWALPGGVDPTGVVKGWAAARALGHVEAAGLDAAMVNAGGDIAVCGRPEPGRTQPGRPWRVALRHPDDARLCLGVVPVAGALATSGTYERGAHVIDPRLGRPGAGAVSATVVGPDLAWADALATGLVAAGAAGLGPIEALAGYEALVVRADGTLVATGGFEMAPAPAALRQTGPPAPLVRI